MDVMHLILIFCFLISLNSFASEPINCSDSEVSFILSNLKSGKLTKEYESNVLLAVKNHVMCNYNNPIMLDGLAYSLYKNNELNYIMVHNGLDGTAKTYGPFKW